LTEEYNESEKCMWISVVNGLEIKRKWTVIADVKLSLSVHASDQFHTRTLPFLNWSRLWSKAEINT
jgi:hypothetical protein